MLLSILFVHASVIQSFLVFKKILWTMILSITILCILMFCKYINEQTQKRCLQLLVGGVNMPSFNIHTQKTPRYISNTLNFKYLHVTYVVIVCSQPF